ncbi:putative yir2 protein [Plasmodium yoelii yoelii]|uniref:Yir2 protein n=1 Tax=Plasmodium yoelii yoelii TaxID=73239 RepID=Q7RTA8_PLAYO|nr:putative yir2 protein [Plasmodium yoelii yoelii]
MNNTLCGKLDLLRKHLPDELNGKANVELTKISDFKNYCPKENCNSELEKITIGFLWLLGQYFTISHDKSYDKNNTNAFFLYIISWLSNQLNQSTTHSTTKINDFYTNHVKNNNKYEKFINDSSKFTELNEVLNTKNDLLNTNIEDLSKFYDASKLICNMYGNIETNSNDKLSDNANDFVKKYQELNGHYNNADGNSYKQILSALSTDYANIKDKCKNTKSLPEITSNISALRSGDTSSSSSIGSKFFTVLSIFGAIAFFLGISYKVNNNELKNIAFKNIIFIIYIQTLTKK